MSRYATQAAVKRAVAAARGAGLDIASVDLLTDGTIRISAGRAAPATSVDAWFEGLDRDNGFARASHR